MPNFREMLRRLVEERIREDEPGWVLFPEMLGQAKENPAVCAYCWADVPNGAPLSEVEHDDFCLVAEATRLLVEG